MRSTYGHRLGSFRDSMLGQLAGQDEADSSLNFTRGDGGLFRVRRKFYGMSTSDFVPRASELSSM